MPYLVWSPSNPTLQVEVNAASKITALNAAISEFGYTSAAEFESDTGVAADTLKVAAREK